MLSFALFLAILGLAYWGLKESSEKKKIRERYRPIVDAERQAKVITEKAQERRDELNRNVKHLRNSVDLRQKELQAINEAINLKSDDFILLESGFYEPVYGFEGLPQFEKELQRIRERQKEMLKQDGITSINAAAYRSEDLSPSASLEQKREVNRLLKNVLKLMLRAFNGECDSYIARVNYKNIEAMAKRIQSSFDQINKLSDPWGGVLHQQQMPSESSIRVEASF